MRQEGVEKQRAEREKRDRERKRERERERTEDDEDEEETEKTRRMTRRRETRTRTLLLVEKGRPTPDRRQVVVNARIGPGRLCGSLGKARWQGGKKIARRLFSGGIFIGRSAMFRA